MSNLCKTHNTPMWEVIEYQDEEMQRTAFKCPMCAANLDDLQSKLRDSQLSCLALREALEAWQAFEDAHGVSERRYKMPWWQGYDALKHTSATAQRVKEYIERAALEAAWERVRGVMIDPPWRVDQRDVGDEIRAAILGGVADHAD